MYESHFICSAFWSKVYLIAVKLAASYVSDWVEAQSHWAPVHPGEWKGLVHDFWQLIVIRGLSVVPKD